MPAPAALAHRAALAHPASLALLVILVAGCSLMPVIGPRSWTQGTLEVDGVERTVRVTDTSGIVRDVEFDPPDADLFGGVTIPAGRPDALDVTWVAGGCDVTTSIEIAGSDAGLDVDVTATTGEAACDGFGTPRAIRLTLARPVPPAAVTVTQ